MAGFLIPDWWTDTITVLRAPSGADRYGDDTRDWDNATEHEIPGCKVNPAESSEFAGSADDRAQLTRRRILAAPRTADLLATDRVRFRDVTYEVEGEPQPWDSPTAAVSHVYAQLVAVEG